MQKKKGSWQDEHKEINVLYCALSGHFVYPFNKGSDVAFDVATNFH